MHFKIHFICFDKKSPYFEHENYFWPQKLQFETLCSGDTNPWILFELEQVKTIEYILILHHAFNNA